MPLTIDKLREKLEKLNNKRSDAGKALWRPKDNHQIRILPIPGQDEPYRAANFHYLDRKPVYCPQTTGDHCVICEAAERFRSWNDENGVEKPEALRKKDFEVFRKIQAGTKYFFPVVEREREKQEKGGYKLTGKFGAVGWWSVSEANYKKLIEIAVKTDLNEMAVEQGGQEGWEVLCNTKLAFDLIVDLKQAENKDGKGNGKTFPLTDIDNTIRLTPLSKDPAEVERVLSLVPSFDEAVRPMTPEEVERAWLEYTNGAGKPVTGGAEDGDGLDMTPSNNAEELSKGKSSVEDAIAKILGK